jgi:VWFA-related protein
MFAALFAVAAALAVPAFAQEQRFAEEVDVRVIDVDVIVTDRQGNPLLNLTRENFQLLEDGRPVEIRYFSRIADGRLSDEPALAAGETTQTAAAPAGAHSPVTWVFFMDQTSMQPSRRNMTLKQLRAFVDRAMLPGDKVMVANNDGASLRIEQGPTEDRSAIITTFTKLEGKGVHQGNATSRASQVRMELSRVSDEDPQADYLATELAQQIALIIEEEEMRTKNAVAAIDALVDTLAKMEGRLAFVYVGAGFNTLPGQALTDAFRARFPARATDPAAPKPEERRQWIERQITGLYEKLSATRVTVYTVQAGDTWMVSAEQQNRQTIGGDIEGASSELAEGASARELAQRTGGLYFRANPQLAQQLDRVRSDLSNYYSLGYVPQGDPGVTHRVRIKVNVDGARVRHRETVRERTHPEEAARVEIARLVQPQVAATLPKAAPSEANPLGIAIQAQAPKRENWAKEFTLPFNFSIQLETLTFVKREVTSRAEFSMQFTVSAPDGTVWPLETREQSLEVPLAEIPDNPDAHVDYVWHVNLSPLKIPQGIPITRDGMQLTVTVLDHATGSRSVVTVPVPKRG